MELDIIQFLLMIIIALLPLFIGSKLIYQMNPWDRWLIYPLLLCILLFIIKIVDIGPYNQLAPFFSSNSSLVTNYESARYVLSTLAQIEATIIALLISLSLIAVQLAASSFSVRVIEIFRKMVDFWIIIGIYLLSIILTITTLKLIQDPSISLSERNISLSIWLGIFSFIIIVPYTLNILDLLKPTTLILNLVQRITRERINMYTRGTPFDNDPFQPVKDVVIASLSNYDKTTFLYGLNQIRDKMIFILKDNDHLSKDEINDASKIISSSLIDIGSFGLYETDQNLLIPVIDCMEDVGILGAKEGIDNLVIQMVDSIKSIALNSLKVGNENVTAQSISSLRSIGLECVKRQQKDAAIQSALSLGDIGEECANKTLDELAKQSIYSLGDIGSDCINSPYRDITIQAETCINAIGQISIGKNLRYASTQSAQSIGAIGLKSVELRKEHIIIHSTLILRNLGIESSEQGLENLTSEAITFLFQMGRKSINLTSRSKNLEDAIADMVSSIELIGIKSIKKSHMKVTNLLLFYLRDIQDISIKNNLSTIESKSNNAHKNILKNYIDIIKSNKKRP